MSWLFSCLQECWCHIFFHFHAYNECCYHGYFHAYKKLKLDLFSFLHTWIYNEKNTGNENCKFHVDLGWIEPVDTNLFYIMNLLVISFSCLQECCCHDFISFPCWQWMLLPRLLSFLQEIRTRVFCFILTGIDDEKYTEYD